MNGLFQINLRLILVSGKTKEFLFTPNDSAADITDLVYNNWPTGKPFDIVSLSPIKRHIIRKIFKIKFLF